MYQQVIKDLSSILRGKRDKAYNYLLATVRTDPKGVVDDFLRYADQKAWIYARGIFSANREGVFRAILARRIGKKEEWILQMLGYSPYIPKIREFYNIKAQVEVLRRRGINVKYEVTERKFLSGKVDEALKEMKEIIRRGRELEKIREKWKKIEEACR